MKRLIATCALATALAAHAQTSDVPYVVTPMNVVDAMLDLADVRAEDRLLDLGSGDGRIVIAAAKRHGAQGIGVELDGSLVSQARREALQQGVAGKVQFRTENLFVTDLGGASVITMYLFPRVLAELRPRIFAETRPGTRVVSHEFDFGEWKPDRTVTVKVPNKPYGAPQSDVMLWVVPANAAGSWQWTTTVEGRPIEATLDVRQRFQMIEATARLNGSSARVEKPSLRGEEIRFNVTGEVNGRTVRQEYSGRIEGDRITGRLRAPNAESGPEWQATRTTRGRINIDAAAEGSSPAALSAKG